MDELVERWVAGWAHVRDRRVGRVDGFALVHVAGASRDVELICPDPGVERLGALLPHVAGRPRAMLTVLAADLAPYAAATLPASVRVDRDDETLMASELAALRTPVPEGLVGRWVVEGDRSTYRLDTADSVAAEGTVGVHGHDAVYDAVETGRAHRRRGLARHVMGELTAHAQSRGARTGLLAATAEGRALYESLGWRPVLAMWSLMGVRP